MLVYWYVRVLVWSYVRAICPVGTLVVCVVCSTCYLLERWYVGGMCSV